MAAGYLWVETTNLHWTGDGVEGSAQGTDDGGAKGTIKAQKWVEGIKLAYIDNSLDPRYITGNPYCTSYNASEDVSINGVADSGFDTVDDDVVLGAQDDTHVSGADGTVEVLNDSGVDSDDDTSANPTNDAAYNADACGVDCANHDASYCPSHNDTVYVGENSSDDGSNYSGVDSGQFFIF